MVAGQGNDSLDLRMPVNIMVGTVSVQVSAILFQSSLHPYLKEVETPTLLPVGEESPTSTLDQQRFMAEQLPDCRLVVYPDLGHGINAIHPEW